MTKKVNKTPEVVEQSTQTIVPVSNGTSYRLNRVSTYEIELIEIKDGNEVVLKKDTSAIILAKVNQLLLNQIRI